MTRRTVGYFCGTAKPTGRGAFRRIAARLAHPETIMNDSGAWHDQLQRQQEAIQRKRRETATTGTVTPTR
ncbi:MULTISPECIES: hypothetical protein [unclassified Amycolatopsis]|uniref:hypothetical protein n=1 Tax=unclassified Amycolatopsis TaxID=2618356 RepID=UPI002E12E4B3|nr:MULTISPECIES: hypothetical protein [unclassified Amycolatopsis]WSJ79898.1 hypothetical protein OG439_13125 [Amycolatopsis sp. NBC_01307]WSK76611.1 hypothetical protein OG570_35395 [Amycolatopsis sp. NBC_01286]